MKLLWSPIDEPERPKSRLVQSKGGQLLGRLDDLLPCLYIAQRTVSMRELRSQTAPAVSGLFAVGARTGGKTPGVAPRLGLLLPLRLCRDERARAPLLEIPALILGATSGTMSQKRHAVQARLDDAFGGDLTLADKESLDGFFALTPGAGLFERLHESLEFVTEVMDDAAGVVRVLATERFGWRSYGELMEWYHGQKGSGRSGAWSALTPFFVCGNTAALHKCSTERWARAGLTRPDEEPAKWFVLRADLPDAQIGLRLEMEKYGWVLLHLRLDDAQTTIQLSQVFDPFPELIEWGREIDEGDLPIQMEIDEEGREAVLTVLRTDHPARVLLRVTSKSTDAVLLEGIVARAELALALKSELRRFFTSEFDPRHWDMGGDIWEDDDEDDEEDATADAVSIKDHVLNHPWLAKAG